MLVDQPPTRIDKTPLGPLPTAPPGPATAAPPGRALIVQSDGSLLLDVHDAGFAAARADIAAFAELEKSPEHMHTYRMSALSLWNAASAGLAAGTIVAALTRHARYPIPESILFRIGDTISRYGRIKLRATDDPLWLELVIDDPLLRSEITGQRSVAKHLGSPTPDGFLVALYDRGTVKQELIKVGYPVADEAPLVDGTPFAVAMRPTTLDGRPFAPRDYQIDAVEAFAGDLRPGTGFGTVVLPCGSGKTIVGITAMTRLQTNTLILTTNVAAVHQWIQELRDKTTIPEDCLGEYTGDRKVIRPITVATYQILVWRPANDDDYPHFHVFKDHHWGLIIYDEVHLLPAPIFRVTAELQAVRRLGLTATLVREDGHETDVFSLVGPKRYDVPWKELEARGWIATAYCHEIRVAIPDHLRIDYATADKRQKFRIAAENPDKLPIVEALIHHHSDDSVLVIGQYLGQLDEAAAQLQAPIITGRTPNPEREAIYKRFREGEIRVLIVSKVANFAIDLPDASVAIQISGSFGSRQEEAQRLGRILRPKRKNSYFYSLVSHYTNEETFSANRQKFLTEQGYSYRIDVWTGAVADVVDTGSRLPA